jgi:hypothetical protein
MLHGAIMKSTDLWRLLRSKLRGISSLVFSLAIGVVAGWFFRYATDVDHPISETPISVDFCFWVSHPDLFRGQPVQTEAEYTQLIEGGAIDQEACKNLDVSNRWDLTKDDPVRNAWERDLESNSFTAHFQLSFVATIPAHPRYVYWLRDANDWRPVHKITTFSVDRLVQFKRIQ